MSRFVIALSILIMVCVGCSPADSIKPEKSAGIKILSARSSDRVYRGTEVEFTVEIEYKLESEEEGTVNVGFNNENPKSFRIVESKNVEKGTGTVSVKARTVVVDWGERGKFTIYVNLAKYPIEAKYEPLASAHQEISIEH